MQIIENTSLKAFNTFGIDVRAKLFGIIENTGDVQACLPLMKEVNRLLLIGSGSNILFTADFDGLVLVNRILGKKILVENEDEVLLQVYGGENWSDLVDFTVEQGWGGLENLSLIPGTVGAAPVQNIGAYGVELKETLVWVEAIDLNSGKVIRLTNTDCGFSYRSSIFKTTFKGRYLILSVQFKLTKKPVLNLSYGPLKAAFAEKNVEEVSVKQVSEAVKSIRRSKLPDPEELGNAGSFFKNPVVPFSKIQELIVDYPEMPFYKVDEEKFKLAAGWLIEKSGWKGKRIGDAGVHEKQALVLVNYGKATGGEIYKLALKIVNSVKDQFGVTLETEVTII
jgi:UDP-N-acetylmuramate dehydrogenase